MSECISWKIYIIALRLFFPALIFFSSLVCCSLYPSTVTLFFTATWSFYLILGFPLVRSVIGFLLFIYIFCNICPSVEFFSLHVVTCLIHRILRDLVLINLCNSWFDIGQHLYIVLYKTHYFFKIFILNILSSSSSFLRIRIVFAALLPCKFLLWLPLIKWPTSACLTSSYN